MTDPAPRTRPWPALAVLCLANFLVLLDTTIVTVALPDVQRSLDVGVDEALWVLDGFLLAFAALLIVAGRLGDVAGPRTVFLLGLGTLTVASLLCAAAQTAGQLVAGRVLQGAGAAAVLPQALVLISALFPAERRGAAFGLFTAVGGIAAVTGPTAGGLLATELGWQSVFLVPVPLGVAGGVLAVRLVPDLRPGRRHRLDLVGVLLATGGLAAVTYGLVEGPRHGWGRVAGPVTIPAVLAAGAVLLVLFVLWERRQPEPLVPPALVADRTFSVAALLTLITSFALFGLLLVFVLQTQAALGMSPWESGLSALPWTLTLTAVAPLAGRLADRVGGRALLVAGLGCFALGVLGVAGVVGDAGSAPGAGSFALPLVVVGVGMGLAVAPATTEALRDVPAHLAGAASGVLNTARQVGAVLGAAVTGAVLQNRLTAALRAAAAERAAQLPEPAGDAVRAGVDAAAARGLQLGSGHGGGIAVPAGLPPDVFGAAFAVAGRTTLTVVAAVLAAGALLATLVRRRPAGAGPPAGSPAGSPAGPAAGSPAGPAAGWPARPAAGPPAGPPALARPRRLPGG